MKRLTSTIKMRPTRRLKEIVFHSSAEHTREGLREPMEAQMVHESPDGKLLIVAVLMRVGEVPNAFLQAALDIATLVTP